MPNENPPVNAFKKGHKKMGGRPPWRRNILTNDLKEALLEAATRVGFVREVDVLDADGKPTGRKVPEWDGDGGLAGYLEWAAFTSPGILSHSLADLKGPCTHCCASCRSSSLKLASSFASPSVQHPPSVVWIRMCFQRLSGARTR